MIVNECYLLLSIFKRFCKITKSDYWIRMSVCPSVRTEQPGSHEADFHEILYSSIFRKSVEKIQVSLKSDKNNWHYT